MSGNLAVHRGFPSDQRSSRRCQPRPPERDIRRQTERYITLTRPGPILGGGESFVALESRPCRGSRDLCRRTGGLRHRLNYAAPTGAIAGRARNKMGIHFNSRTTYIEPVIAQLSYEVEGVVANRGVQLYR